MERDPKEVSDKLALEKEAREHDDRERVKAMARDVKAILKVLEALRDMMKTRL